MKIHALNNTINSNMDILSRNRRGLANLNEADFADVLCTTIATGIFAGNIFPIYPAYCVRLYVLISSGVSGLAGVVTTYVLSRWLPKAIS